MRHTVGGAMVAAYAGEMVTELRDDRVKIFRSHAKQGKHIQ